MRIKATLTSIVILISAISIQAPVVAKPEAVKLVILPVDMSNISDEGLASFKQYAKLAGQQAADFWTTNTNGALNVSLEVRNPVSMSFPPVCNSEVELARILSRFGVGSPKPNTYYMAFIGSAGPQYCGSGAAGKARIGGQTGWAKLAMSPTVDGRVIAHELGHNFGLYHVAEQKCKSGAKVVPLSRKCSVVNEYGDALSIMGQGDDLSALERDLLGENIRNVRVNSPRKKPYIIADTRSKTSNRQLIFTPSLGWITLEYDSRAGVSLRRLDKSRAMQMVLNFGPETLGYRANLPDRTQFLLPGDSYRIPGTTLRITIGSEGTTAQVYVTNAKRPLATLPPPTGVTVSKAVDEDTGDLGLTVNWSSVPGKVAAYRVLVDGKTACIANPSQQSVVVIPSQMPEAFELSTSKVSVTAVNTSGRQSAESEPGYVTEEIRYAPFSLGWDSLSDGGCRFP